MIELYTVTSFPPGLRPGVKDGVLIGELILDSALAGDLKVDLQVNRDLPDGASECVGETVALMPGGKTKTNFTVNIPADKWPADERDLSMQILRYELISGSAIASLADP